jgi:hypothetical protein
MNGVDRVAENKSGELAGTICETLPASFIQPGKSSR